MINLNKLIKAVLDKPRGVDRKIFQERPAKVKKAFVDADLVKQSLFWGRFVGYGKQQTVKDAKENGRQDKPNNWQSLQSDCDGLFKDHKGQIKLCIGHPALVREHKSEFLLNGKLAKYEDVEHMLLSSDKRKSGKPLPDWYTLNARNIVAIDGELVQDVEPKQIASPKLEKVFLPDAVTKQPAKVN